MSLDIKYIKDTEGNNYFPVVHEKGVVDDNGTTLESKLQSKQDAISDIDTIRNKANSAIQSVTVGTTTTGAAGSSASVTNTGTATEPVLSFTIPQGAQGIQGIQGPQGERGPQGNTGVQVDSVASIIHSIDPTATYAAADVAGADAVQDVLSEVTELSGIVSETTVFSGSLSIPQKRMTYTSAVGFEVGKTYVIQVDFSSAQTSPWSLSIYSSQSSSASNYTLTADGSSGVTSFTATYECSSSSYRYLGFWDNGTALTATITITDKKAVNIKDAVVQNRNNIDEIYSFIYTDEIDETSGTPLTLPTITGNYVNTSTSQWATSANYAAYLIPITAWKAYKIKVNTAKPTEYFFSKSMSTSGAAAFATGSTIHGIEANGESDYLIAPSDAVSLYLIGKYAGTTLSLIVNEYGFLPVNQTVNELSEKVSLLQESQIVTRDTTVAYNSIYWVKSKFVQADTTNSSFGELVTAGDAYMASDFIDCSEAKTVSCFVTRSTTCLYCGIVFYDSSKAVLSSWVNNSSSDVTHTMNIPEGASYFRTTSWYGNVDSSNTAATIHYEESVDNVVSSNRNRISEIEAEVGESNIVNLLITDYSSGYFIQADSTNSNFGKAVTIANQDYSVSPFIPITGYDRFAVPTLTSSTQSYAGIVIYDIDKNPITGYYQSAAAGSYTVKAELPSNAAYIRISHWAGYFSGKLITLKLWDTLKDFSSRKIVELDNRVSVLESKIPQGLTQYEYIGEKITFTPKFAGTTYMQLSLSGTGQGGAIYGNTYFVGTNNNTYLNVFDLVSKTKLAAIQLDAVPITESHANTLAFSSQFYTTGDEFPLLYICSGYTDSSNNSQIYGYRIINDNNTWTATLVHTINIENGGTWSEYVVDNNNHKAWIKALNKWYCIDEPQMSGGNVSIDLSLLTPMFAEKGPGASAQGHFFYNGKIYYCAGTPSQGVSKLGALNTNTGVLDSVVDLTFITGLNEPENVFVYNGYLYVGYRDSIWRLYFD